MDPDYDGFVEYMKSKGAIPVVLVYAKYDKTNDSYTLDYLTTPAYEDADATMKKDIKGVTGRVAEAL